MQRTVPFMALLAVSAGLVASTPAAAQLPGPVYVSEITFRAPVRMDYTDPAQIGGPGEPSIKVDSAGTIYVAGVCCVARAAPAWYSKDGGLTFRDLPSTAGLRERGVGAEGDFVIDENDGVYFADTWVPSILVTKWTDHGDTWNYTLPTTGVPPGLNDRPWLAYAKGALYLYVNHGTHIAVYRSTDGGRVWSSSFSTLGRGQRYWTGHVSADRQTGSVYVFGANCELGPLCAAASHDSGQTWKEYAAGTLPRGARASFMVASAVDAAGNVYGTFADTNNTGCDVYLAVSTDRAATWRQYRINPLDGCATFPWLTAGDDGRVALSWYYNPSKKSQNQVPASSEWRMQAAVVSEATSESPTVTYGTLPQPIHNGPLNRELWDYQQIAVGPDGRFHVAFAEDAVPPCSGSLSTHGQILAYQNMCTTYVGQDGGPRLTSQPAPAG